jgi:hypothetical protein
MGRRGRKDEKGKAARSWLSGKSGSTRRQQGLRSHGERSLLDVSRQHGGPADQIVVTLEQAGYDPSDMASIERGMTAFMAAQTIVMAALGGEATVDHGVQNGPLGGVVPEMIPLLEPRAMMEDAKGLVTIFKQDPELRQVRFNTVSATGWLNAVIHERPEGKEDANAWLDEIAAEFAAHGANRPVVEGLSEQLLKAAPRWVVRPAALRYIAAGYFFATMAEKDHGTNPLTAMLFRLSVWEPLEDQ